MRRAASTPTPSLGKNVSGGNDRHLPRAIHSRSMSLRPFCLVTTRGGDVLSAQFVLSRPSDWTLHLTFSESRKWQGIHRELTFSPKIQSKRRPKSGHLRNHQN